MLKKKPLFFNFWVQLRWGYTWCFFERSSAEGRERRPQAASGARNQVARKTKMIKKKQSYDDDEHGTNFALFLLLYFLSKFLTLSLTPKTFPHVLQYSNLSKRHSEKFFCEQKLFFPKKIIHFFFFVSICFFSICYFSIFFF